MIKGQPLSLLKYHLTDSFQAPRHRLFKWQTKLVLCVCVCACIRLGAAFLSLTPPTPHHPSHTRNLTPLFHRSGPASHLSYLPLPKLRGPSPCTCKLHPVLTCVSRLTSTLVAIDFVDALPVVTRFALTVIQIDLTVETCTLNSKIWGKKCEIFYSQSHVGVAEASPAVPLGQEHI